MGVPKQIQSRSILEFEWLRDSLDVVRGYSKAVRLAIGSELRLLQTGEKPLHARPLKTVGRGVWELKICGAEGQFRVVYVIERKDRIYVLHAFQKNRSRRLNRTSNWRKHASRRSEMARVTKGNVFEDLGFSREEATELAMKVDLASELRKFIERQGLTQMRAAGFFNVPRPKISHIQSNKLDGISIEYLVRMLAKTGGKLSYRFRQPSKQVVEARVRKRAAA